MKEKEKARISGSIRKNNLETLRIEIPNLYNSDRKRACFEDTHALNGKLVCIQSLREL